MIDRGATFDETGRYRYRLWRRWADGPMALFVMLNPSTAHRRVGSNRQAPLMNGQKLSKQAEPPLCL